MLLVNRLCGFAQTKANELTWQMDTSGFAPGKRLPAAYRGGIKQMPMIIQDGAKTTLFSYPVDFGNEKIYLNCCLAVNPDSALLAIDNNFDSIFQEIEIFRYTLDQYKSENMVINFSVSKQNYDEAFFMIGSIKKTSLKVNTPDSLLNLNPLYLQSKNYLRSSFSEGGEKYHVVLMNTFPAFGNDRNFQYLVTKKEMDDSAFSKIINWSHNNDTILINEKQALVAARKSNGTIGFNVFEATGLYGTFMGAKMPAITVTDIENSIVQLPVTRPGRLHLIEFWGTWCGPCVALYPRLSSLLKANANLITYTGIAGNDDKEKVLRYISKKPDIKHQVFEPNNNKSIVQLFKIEAYPTFILIDDKGIIAARASGDAGFDLVEKLINEEGKRRNKTLKEN
jgi:thiol-disulfide isomerase/thioredoxin